MIEWLSAMLITTSRNPTHQLRRMSKIIALSFPNSQRLTRGSLSLDKVFRYCWNQQIFRLLILQKNSGKDSILVKAYSIGEKPQPIKATIKITEMISLQKHNKTQRILIEKVKLDFTDQVNEEIMEQIIDFLSPIIQKAGNKRTKKLLTMSFRKTKSTSLIGHVVQHNSSQSLPLYTIHISSECVNDD
ncbi:MAG: hypothetical protein ACW991_01030 [Candidatus Hodarchaeales archaeon]